MSPMAMFTALTFSTLYFESSAITASTMPVVTETSCIS